MMVARGAAIGVDWESEIESLRSVDWEAERAKIEDKSLQMPAYYLVRHRLPVRSRAALC